MYIALFLPLSRVFRGAFGVQDRLLIFNYLHVRRDAPEIAVVTEYDVVPRRFRSLQFPLR